MPSRKGKGRQSLGFGSKLQRAQFHKEWQTKVQEDYYKDRHDRLKARQRQQHRNEKSKIQISSRCHRQSSTTGGDCNYSSLRRLIAERQYWDRLEDRSWIYGQVHAASQQQATTSQSSTSSSARVSIMDTSPPGWLIFHSLSSTGPGPGTTTRHDEFADSLDAHEFLTKKKIPSLQSLALHQLALSLPEYVEALGVEQLTDYLSLLPGPALSVLSVKVSQAGLWSNEIVKVIGTQTQLTRFSIVAPSNKATDSDLLQPNRALKLLLSSNAMNNIHNNNNTPILLPTTVPDSWEEWIDDELEQDHPDTTTTPTAPSLLPTLPYRSTSSWQQQQQRLERLELGNLPLLEVHVLKQLLTSSICSSTLTHLGLSGSLTYYNDRGPDVLWQLASWVPNLQVLDVSGNVGWVTEPVLRSVYESYAAVRNSCRQRQQEYNPDVDTTTEELNLGTTSDHESRSTCRRNVAVPRGSSSSSSSSSSTTTNYLQPPQRQEDQPAPLIIIIIKATGCLPRSSQILMEMEFGTIF